MFAPFSSLLVSIIKNQLEYIFGFTIICLLKNIHNKGYFRKSVMNLFCFNVSYKCLVTDKKGKSQSVFNQVKISTSVNVRSMTSPDEKKLQATFRSFDVHLFHNASFVLVCSIQSAHLAALPHQAIQQGTVSLVFLVLFLGDCSTHWSEWLP